MDQHFPTDAFSRVALQYDLEFSSLPEVVDLRSRVYRIARREFPEQGRILDIACGTGEDLLILARHGYSVVGSDASPGMLQVAAAKCLAHGVDVPVVCTRAEQIGTFRPNSFGAILSNFGGLNCIEDLTPVLAQCYSLLQPGGVMLLCMINRTCFWEFAGHLAKGQPGRAMRRWSHSGVYVPVGGSNVLTWYHTVSRIRAMAGRRFRVTGITGLNIITPPPSWQGFRKRHPRLLAFLRALESRVQGIFPFSRLGDHLVLVLRRDG
jgi:ubiquinone/menaquinone biosynthesis C-methylase UbiE